MSAERRGPSWAHERHMARTLALQALFEADYGARPMDEILEARFEEAVVSRRVEEYAARLARSAWERRAEYDATIAELAPTWPLEQMARVDRNILRLAMYEIHESAEVPLRAAINEAVELAKEFGGDASPRFINGVLGSVAARRTGGDARGSPGADAEDPPVAPEAR